MSNKKYVMVSLDDEKLGVLAEVLSNKTAKKIIEFLADKEASESEISQELKLPANTVNYNVKKLVEAGLIEKSKNYFWSRKGKKMIYYKVAKKSIIISPKSSNAVKVVSTILITGIVAVLVKMFFNNTDKIIEKSGVIKDNVNAGLISGLNNTINNTIQTVSAAPGAIVASEQSLKDVSCLITQQSSIFTSQPWFWFVIGALVFGVIYLVLSNVKLKRK